MSVHSKASPLSAQMFIGQLLEGPNVIPFAGTSAASLASDDFDGDGFKDLASRRAPTANYKSSTSNKTAYKADNWNCSTGRGLLMGMPGRS